MDVAGLGRPYFDQVVLIDKLPLTDQHPRSLESSWQYGGKVATALIAIARLGYRAAMHGNVGGIFGRCIRLDFERHGVDCSRLIDIPGTQSGACVALAEKSTGGRSFVGIPHERPVPDPKPEDLDREAFIRAKWLLISELTPTTLQAARWFKEAGKPVVVDADYMPPNDMQHMEWIDHFIGSEDTYRASFGSDQAYEKNLRILRAKQKNDRAVTVVTLGSKGAVGIDEAGKFFSLPAYRVPVVDTTGAGDVFHGAYIAGRLNGDDAESACRFASAVSAVKCTRLGGRAGIPTMEQVHTFMQTGQYDFPEFEERAAYYREPPFDRVSK